MSRDHVGRTLLRSSSVIAVFVLILLTTYWPGRKSQIERHGRIPLEDDR